MRNCEEPFDQRQPANLDQSPESALSACRTIGGFRAAASFPWFAAADEMASAVTATERLPSTMRSIASVTWSKTTPRFGSPNRQPVSWRHAIATCIREVRKELELEGPAG